MHKILLGSATLTVVVMGGLVCVQNRQAIAQPAIAKVASTPDITNPNDYRGALPLRLPDNSQLPESDLISRAQILSSRDLPESAKHLSLELTTWGSHAAEVGDSPEIAEGRQIWVLKDEYAEYEHYRFGAMKNAQTTTVFDAETGELLSSNVVGIPLNPGRSSFPARLVVPFSSDETTR